MGIGGLPRWPWRRRPMTVAAPEQPAPEAPVPKPEMTEQLPRPRRDRPATRHHPAACDLPSSERPRAADVPRALTFVIESPQLVRIVTDYNDYLRRR